MKFGTDIHVALRMNYKVDPLTFRLAPPSGQP